MIKAQVARSVTQINVKVQVQEGFVRDLWY